MPTRADRPDQLRRIKIIDDDPGARETYGTLVEITDREPVDENGPLGSLDDYLKNEIGADAAISDNQLKPGNYAYFDGIELVAAWYKRGVPALLCTNFDKSNVIPFRQYRPWVPVVMSPDQLDPDTLESSLELVQQELKGTYVPARRPWRAQVHFVDIEHDMKTTYVKVPAWSQKALALRTDTLPSGIQERLRGGDIDFRCHAQANLGAEDGDDVYLCEWEPPTR